MPKIQFHIIIKKITACIAIALTTLTLASCSDISITPPSAPVGEYITKDAAFTLTFPPLSSEEIPKQQPPDPVICTCEKSGSEITLTVTSPERSAGMKVRVTIGATQAVTLIPPPGSDPQTTPAEIPLSPAAIEKTTLPTLLNAMFPTNYRAAADPDSDGIRLISDSDTGEVILTDSLPTRVTSSSGYSVEITDYIAK